MVLPILPSALDDDDDAPAPIPEPVWLFFRTVASEDNEDEVVAVVPELDDLVDEAVVCIAAFPAVKGAVFFFSAEGKKGNLVAEGVGGPIEAAFVIVPSPAFASFPCLFPPITVVVVESRAFEAEDDDDPRLVAVVGEIFEIPGECKVPDRAAAVAASAFTNALLLNLLWLVALVLLLFEAAVFTVPRACPCCCSREEPAVVVEAGAVADCCA